MESLEDSNGHSMSDSFSLYERYMRSFKVVGSLVTESDNHEPSERVSSSDNDNSNSRGNIDLSIVQNNINKHCITADSQCDILNTNACANNAEKHFSLDDELCAKVESPCSSLAASLLENSSATVEHSLLNDKSNPNDVHASSEDSKQERFKQPVFITSTMENSNNAVDSVPMFHDTRHGDNVFKLPIRELSFNGTLKHVQKLKPIVDPLTALSSNNGLVNLEDKSQNLCTEPIPSGSDGPTPEQMEFNNKNLSDGSDKSNDNEMNRIEKTSDSTGDSQYEEFNVIKECPVINDDRSTVKWNLEQSYSSLEASFDSGVRSPDMFSDNDDDDTGSAAVSEPFWSFLKDFEAYDKRKLRKVEETLQGVLPPPSVTILRTDVTEMLKKYYCFLPVFNDSTKIDISEANSMTPTKLISIVQVPEHIRDKEEAIKCSNSNSERSKESSIENELNASVNGKSVDLKMCNEIEAKETAWPDVIKCRHYDVYYNITKYSEKFELLSLRYGERYVGAETDTSVNIYSGGLQSPSSASKRKSLRLKMAQAKSPGRRLSHLARRRQAFCSAATINEKAQASTAKMVLIDKKKLINSSERKSPRTRRTPGKRTPIRKTPGKKTPAKTPKTRSGGSSKKKAMRRLLMDTETLTRSQPSRETLKRALFISPENRKNVPPAPSSSVPVHAMKTKRALFGSPVRMAETKSLDGTQSDQFLKRKLNALDDKPEYSRSKIAKSLSFGGDTAGSAQSISFSRRASEVFSARNTAQLNDNHKQKLLWAVSEALRVHGWRMSSPGFREKASALAQLTRKLFSLPTHASKLAATKLSTSDTMLKLARQYVFAIIQGRTVDDCFQEEQLKLANEANSKVSGYISATTYQQMRARQITAATFTSQIKENTCSNVSVKQDQSKSGTKNVLQDKLVNIDSNSNSSSGLSILDKTSLGLFKSNSMPSFEEAAKMRARRQISFDNVDFPKR